MKNRTILGLLLLCISCHSHRQHQHVQSEQEAYFGQYSIIDHSYGTETKVIIRGDKRIIKTNALPNHQTGDFPNEGNPNRISMQDRSYTLPLQGQFSGQAKPARLIGVAINGIKMEPGTAEAVHCETGERYRIEAIQENFNLGLDFNHAHVQPTGAYHYHGSPTSLILAHPSKEDLIHIGFAMDGFPIYYSKSGAYKPSYQLSETTRKGSDCTYANPHHSSNVSIDNTIPNGSYDRDWIYMDQSGDLDECNGIEINGAYCYLVTDEYPYIGRCLKGVFKEEKRDRRGPPPRRPR